MENTDSFAGFGKETLLTFRKNMDLRNLIEGFAAREAALHVREGVSPENLLLAFLEMSKTISDITSEEFDQSDQNIHLEILRLSRVPGIIPCWQEVFAISREFRKQTFLYCWPDSETLLEAHRSLIEAICQGKPELAEKLAIEHTNPVWSRIEKKYHPWIHGNRYLSQITAYIQFHFHEKITLPWLAEMVVPISSGYIRHLFQKELNTTFTDYLRDVRMQHAADLLKKTTFPIQKIAELTGYQDSSRFTRHFKAHYQLLPREYRKRKWKTSNDEENRQEK
ncbi:MAG: helix-turn-helix domain-containing protein [Planctomycetia bacterium]|nr:helix-turn-helix domain-containing protein [Planctomycetia bacterium]